MNEKVNAIKKKISGLMLVLLAVCLVFAGCGGKKGSGMSVNGQRSVNDVLQSGMDDYDGKGGAVRYGCLMQDALGCCSQGFEFRLKNGKYPKAETRITVTGTLDIYEDENDMYCFLKDAVLE